MATHSSKYSCLENPMDRSLVGYSPWGHKESDTTEQLTHTHWYKYRHPLNFALVHLAFTKKEITSRY